MTTRWQPPRRSRRRPARLMARSRWPTLIHHRAHNFTTRHRHRCAAPAIRSISSPPTIGSGTISVALGNGDGTFQTPVTYAVGNNPIAVAIGDLTGDGKLDIAVANYGSGTVSVLTRQRRRHFPGNAVTYNVGASPRGVAIADLDGKNGNDLVVANWSSHNVSVLLDKGNGTFAAAVNYTVGNSPGNVLLADLNGDGKLDIVSRQLQRQHRQRLARQRRRHLRHSSRLPRRHRHNRSTWWRVDLNGDHKLDLATSNVNGSTVSVLLNQGTPSTAYSGEHLRGPCRLHCRRQHRPITWWRPTSTATARWTWPWLATAAIRSACCWATATALCKPPIPTIVHRQSARHHRRRLQRRRHHRPGRRPTHQRQHYDSVGQRPQSVASGCHDWTGVPVYGRGNLLTTSTVDYSVGRARPAIWCIWRRKRRATPGQSGLLLPDRHAGDGSALTSFNANYNNQGQSTPITLPYTGTYSCMSAPTTAYTGEYRFRRHRGAAHGAARHQVRRLRSATPTRRR